jgi:hypothetical protein
MHKRAAAVQAGCSVGPPEPAVGGGKRLPGNPPPQVFVPFPGAFPYTSVHMPTLNWISKDAVVKHHHEVPFHLLKDVPDLGSGDPGAGNLVVRGDNLVALKALLPHYAGQVKCACIDPPYNTGNEGWAYNDNVNSPVIRDWLGKVVGKVKLDGETGAMTIIVPLDKDEEDAQ